MRGFLSKTFSSNESAAFVRGAAATVGQVNALEEEIKAGAFFECGCCFGDTAISQLSALVPAHEPRTPVR